MFAISVDPPENAAELAKKLKLTFPVLTDRAGVVTRKWGVYDGTTDIAKPSTFLVLKGGAIAYKYVGNAPSDRPSAVDIVEVADKYKPAASE